jgi:hypothetical protein
MTSTLLIIFCLASYYRTGTRKGGSVWTYKVMSGDAPEDPAARCAVFVRAGGRCFMLLLLLFPFFFLLFPPMVLARSQHDSRTTDPLSALPRVFILEKFR